MGWASRPPSNERRARLRRERSVLRPFDRCYPEPFDKLRVTLVEGLRAGKLRNHRTLPNPQDWIIYFLEIPNRLVLKYPNIVLQYANIVLKYPNIILKYPNIVLKYPNIVLKYPNIILKYPNIILKYPNSETKLTLIKIIYTAIWIFFNFLIFYMLYAAIAIL